MKDSDILKNVCAAIDWDTAALAEGKELIKKGDQEAAFISYIDQWRACSRRRPWTPEYVIECRALAKSDVKNAARKCIKDYIANEQTNRTHAPYMNLRDESFFLGIDEGDIKPLADKALEIQDLWHNCPWGTTDSVVKALLRILALPECEKPLDLLPIFGWLIEILPREWQWSRDWEADMLGSGGHNWWLHTYRGFYLVGLHFPEILSSGKFKHFSEAYIHRELDLLMEDDGFTRERSGYHWGTVDHWTSFVHHMSCDDSNFSTEATAKIQTIGDSVWKTAMPYGGMPLWGDTTPSYFNQELRDDRLEDKMPKLAAFLQIPEMKYVVESLYPNWQPPSPGFLPGFGQNLWDDWQSLDVRSPDTINSDTVLKTSQYYMMRTDWSPNADALAIAAGPQGNVISSHDHSHVGTFEYFIKGKPVLADNASGPYDDSNNRNWRVSSAAHNVTTVDGRSHIPELTQWRWAHPVMPMVQNWHSERDYAYLSVVHEGYASLEKPIAGHMRKFFWVRGGYAIIIDRFIMNAQDMHCYDSYFHFLGDHEIVNDQLFINHDGSQLAIIPIPGMSGELTISPNPHPAENYDNPSHARIHCDAEGNHIMATLLVPYSGDRPDVSTHIEEIHCDERILESIEATALSITIDGETDFYFDQHRHWNLPWTAAGHSGSQRLYHSKAKKG